MVSRRSPLITETADFAPVQTLPVRAGLGDRNADFENLGSEKLVLTEVQTSDYLGEDDIVRFQDIYGRASWSA